ncbi:hypothetical protein M3Y99_00875200 [Aphelenchoides fujianensis]|nr:hypothetical protein M3Y99_00875200 [Aphelenchoides fujianensis]
MGTPYLLSVSAIFALVGLALVAIAGFTDNWAEYTVNRKELFQNVKKTTDLNDVIYFSRNYGLYLVCFPDAVPSGSNSFSKLGNNCLLNRDFFPDETTRNRYNVVQIQRMHFIRATVVTYFAGLALGFIALLTGAIGCFKTSAKVTLCAGFVPRILMAVGMVLWHYVQYTERRVLNVHPFYQTWEPVLKQNTSLNYGYSYILAWFGIGLTIVAALCLIRRKEGIYDSKHAAYYQQYDKSIVPYSGGQFGTYEIYPTQNYYGQQQFYPTMGAPHYYGHHILRTLKFPLTDQNPTTVQYSASFLT